MPHLIETPESVTLCLADTGGVPWSIIWTDQTVKNGNPALPWPALSCRGCGRLCNVFAFARVLDSLIVQHDRCLDCDPHWPADMPIGPDGKLKLRSAIFHDDRGHPIMVKLLTRKNGRAEMGRFSFEAFRFRKMTGLRIVRLQPHKARDNAAVWQSRDKSPAAARARKSRSEGP